MADTEFVLQVRKTIRETRASLNDIEKMFKLDTQTANTIYNHLKNEMLIPYRMNSVTSVDQLTYSQECWVFFMVKKFFDYRTSKLAKIISRRIERTVTKDFISQIKRCFERGEFTEYYDSCKVDQDLTMAGMDYLVDLETSEINDDIFFFKTNKYAFVIKYANGDLMNTQISFYDSKNVESVPSFDYDVAIAVGRCGEKFITSCVNSISIAHIIRILENIKNYCVQHHKNHVTIVAEYSHKIQLAINHVCRIFHDFTFKYIVIPPVEESANSPLDFIFNYIEKCLAPHGPIVCKSLPALLKGCLNSIDTAIFDVCYEDHIKKFYPYLYKIDLKIQCENI